MKPSEALDDILDRLPDLDDAGKLTGPTRELAEELYEEILDEGDDLTRRANRATFDSNHDIAE